LLRKSPAKGSKAKKIYIKRAIYEPIEAELDLFYIF